MREKALPPGRFRYEHGSYGGPGGYMPSILCYKETAPNSWVEHFCLVKPDAVFDGEDSACEAAKKHLAEAHALMSAGGDIHDFALSLRHKGYKSVADFRMARDSKGAYNELANLLTPSPSLKQDDDSGEPSDDQIEQVARVLSEWNPLGDEAGRVPDLDGYRTEAADILFGLYLPDSNRNVTQMVRDVLNEIGSPSSSPKRGLLSVQRSGSRKTFQSSHWANR
jgi:hypothetical protein